MLEKECKSFIDLNFFLEETKKNKIKCKIIK